MEPCCYTDIFTVVYAYFFADIKLFNCYWFDHNSDGKSSFLLKFNVMCYIYLNSWGEFAKRLLD